MPEAHRQEGNLIPYCPPVCFSFVVPGTRVSILLSSTFSVLGLSCLASPAFLLLFYLINLFI